MAKYNKLFKFAIPSLLTLGVLSCGTTPQVDVLKETRIWSTYDTVKVVRSIDSEEYFDVLEGKIDISMMRNESESGQIIITPKTRINSYNLIKTSLKRVGGSETISEDNITVYAQKYIEIDNKFNTGNLYIQSGDEVPDMLLPMETCVEYKENFIEKNTNQGITVDVKTTNDTVPGTYRGNFVLQLNNQEINIPVSVTVWDINKTGRDKIQSCFLIYKNYLLQGEYDTTEEMIYKYYDALLDFNVNSYVIRNVNHTPDVVNEYVEQMKLRRDNENFNSIVIPVYFSQTYKCDSGVAADIQEKEACYRYIKGLTLASTEESSLIDMAYFYTSAFDEADAYKATGLYDQALEFYRKGGQLEQTLRYCQNKLQEEGVFDTLLSNGESQEYVNHVKEFIMNIPSVWPTTTFDDAEVDNTIVTNCPVLHQFNTGIYEQKLREGRFNSNGNLWTYTCSGPTYPHPTFHLDDFNLGSRVTGWMMKKYNINGYLYWAVNLYEPVGKFGSLDNWVDPYTTPNRAGKVPGDGYLLYPGRKYNHYGPYPTNRLMAYRDGEDDYEMLSIYEQLLQEKAARYNIEIDVNDYVDDLYDTLFSGSIYIKNDALVHRARKILAERIMSIQNEDELIFDSYSDGTNHISTIYASEPGLTINNQYVMGEKAGSGYKFIVITPVNTTKELKIESHFVYTFPLHESGFFVNKDTRIKASENSSFVVNDDNSLNLTINSAYKDDGHEIGGATQRFTPSISFATSSMKKINTIQFDVTNTSDMYIEIRIYISNDVTDNEVDSIALQPGQTRRMSINVNKFSENFLDSAVEWSFRLTNVRLNSDNVMELYPTRTFSVTPIVFNMKGE